MCHMGQRGYLNLSTWVKEGFFEGYIYTLCLYCGSDEVVLCENVSVCTFYKVIKQAALCSVFLLDSATHVLRTLRADNVNVFWPHMVGGISLCMHRAAFTE